jgi:drug/metabolite transporter (DMT)-like permease
MLGGREMKKWAYLFIVMGAILWGMIAIFVQALYSYGFTPLQVVGIRVITSALMLILYVTLTNRSLLKIHLYDVKYFIGTGVFSIVFFNWCYFTAIQESSISIAAILLYTGPAFVTIMSRILFKEWLKKQKIFSLFITFIGCSFVVGFLPHMNQSIPLYGVIVGLGSGFGYALYSIFGKFALQKYHPMTVTTYTFIFASIAVIPISGLWNSIGLFLNWKLLGYSIGLGLFPTVLAFLFYTVGLSYVESSRASIMATIEPIVATIVGTVLFSQKLTMWQIMGILLIIIAVVVVQERKKVSNPEIKKKRAFAVKDF